VTEHSPRSEGPVSKHEFDRARDPSLHWLAAGTVHDVNNLLVLVIGCAELALDDESLSPRARQLMQEIVGVGERASSLTRQFLALGRPAGAPAAAVDVAAVLASADALLRRVTGDAIQVWIDPGPTAQWVLAEASQIEQVLVNLAGNARDAMPSGGTLRISVRDVVDRRSGGDAAGPPAQLTRIVVADNGRGIDPAVQDRMFDAFFTTKPEGKGSGLGLAVVRAIVDELGGAIQVTTAPGQGTTFTIDLPQAAAPGA
jgi:two-component system cell cycle sensor histidine kinase/response regulator CckA